MHAAAVPACCVQFVFLWWWLTGLCVGCSFPLVALSCQVAGSVRVLWPCVPEYVQVSPVVVGEPAEPGSLAPCLGLRLRLRLRLREQRSELAGTFTLFESSTERITCRFQSVPRHHAVCRVCTLPIARPVNVRQANILYKQMVALAGTARNAEARTANKVEKQEGRFSFTLARERSIIARGNLRLIFTHSDYANYDLLLLICIAAGALA